MGPRRLALAVILFCAAGPTQAQSLGIRGNVWDIAEQDMIDMIKSRIEKLDRQGKIKEYQEKARRDTLAKLHNPPPLPGIKRVTQPQTRTLDLSYTTDKPVRDHVGNLIVPAGYSINPLDHINLTKSLVFIDARDRGQVDFAQKQLATNPRNKIILVGGSWLELSRKWNRQVYYDQNATLTRRLQITSVPSVVSQRGRQLVVEEVAL